jgi:hypothetical protein
MAEERRTSKQLALLQSRAKSFQSDNTHKSNDKTANTGHENQEKKDQSPSRPNSRRMLKAEVSKESLKGLPLLYFIYG